jgi:hypothetical protein
MADSSQKASLGCGTLILIALIVMIFSRGGEDKKSSQKLEVLRNEMQTLSASVSAMSAGTAELKGELQELRKSVAALRDAIGVQQGQISDLKALMPKPGTEFQPLERNPDIEAPDPDLESAPEPKAAPTRGRSEPGAPPQPGLREETLPLEED